MSERFTLTDWHRLHRSRRSGSNVSRGSLWLARSNATELPISTPAPGSVSAAAGGAELAACKVQVLRQDIICKNSRNVHEEYHFEECLGKGSFGQVHKVLHIRTGVHRAIKELPKTATVAEDFEWELRALIALDHPHIVQVIEHFEEPDRWFIVMELCTGPDLFTYILEQTEARDESGPRYIPERDVSVILRQCTKAVLCCHAHGFVHRDLNVKNFMLSGTDMTVKLIDFGLATRFLPNDKYEEIVGTAHYMAPEMMLNGEWTTAVDIWSLGVVFFVLLTGTLLLPNDDEKKKKLLRKVNFSQLRLQSCRQLKARCVSDVARDLIEQMLRHEPSDRITAAKTLSHPFIVSFCHDSLGPPFESGVEFDVDVVHKMRQFSEAPRLKKVALLVMSHLATPERREKELLRAQHTFRTMDTDGDGEITLEEMRQALTDRCLEAPSDLADIFAICDSNNMGRLTFVEFVACLLPSDFADERLCSEVFNVLDRDYSGCINAEDLRLAHPSYDLQTCRDIIGEVDLQKKGYLEFSDFHRFMCGLDDFNAGEENAQEEDVPEPPHVKQRLA